MVKMSRGKAEALLTHNLWVLSQKIDTKTYVKFRRLTPDRIATWNDYLERKQLIDIPKDYGFTHYALEVVRNSKTIS